MFREDAADCWDAALRIAAPLTLRFAVTRKNLPRSFDLRNAHQDFCSASDFRVGGERKGIRKCGRGRLDPGALHQASQYHRLFRRFRFINYDEWLFWKFRIWPVHFCSRLLVVYGKVRLLRHEKCGGIMLNNILKNVFSPGESATTFARPAAPKPPASPR